MKELFKKIVFWFKNRKQNWYNTQKQEANASKISGKEAITRVESTEILSKSTKVRIYQPLDRPNRAMKITSPFGWRTLRSVGKKQYHRGVDFRSFDSPRIIAVEEGVIKKVLLPDYEYPCKFKWTGKIWRFLKLPKNRAWEQRNPDRYRMWRRQYDRNRRSRGEPTG